MQAKALLYPARIDRGLKRHEKTGSALYKVNYLLIDDEYQIDIEL